MLACLVHKVLQSPLTHALDTITWLGPIRSTVQGNTCDFIFTIMPLTKTAERSNSSKFDMELTWQDLVRRQVMWSDLTRVKCVQKLCPYNIVVCFKKSLPLKSPTNMYRGELFRICLHKRRHWNGNSETTSRNRTMTSKEQNLENKSQEGEKWRWKGIN